MHDLVIRGGSVVDGTGRPARTADVAIDDGRITEVGDDVGAARRELEADGLLVTPGWVDIHSHYDGQSPVGPALGDLGRPRRDDGGHGQLRSGIRTRSSQEDRAWTIALMEGVEDIPAAVLDEGLRWQWESFPEYLDALEASPHAIDVAAQVPHAPLRVFAMGERGIDHAEAPTDDEIRVMGRLAAESIEAGALGFSTSRSRNHKASDGRITPTLLGWRRRVAGYRRGDRAHRKRCLRNQRGEHGRRWRTAVDASYLRGQSGGRCRRRCCSGAASRATTTAACSTGSRRRRPDGLALWGQVAPRPTGLLMSAQRPGQPDGRLTDLPRGGGRHRADLLAELQRPEVKDKILSELPRRGGSHVPLPMGLRALRSASL